jgi:hypothetical protein
MLLPIGTFLPCYVVEWWKHQLVRVELDERVERAGRLGVGEGECHRVELMTVSRLMALK